MMHGYLPLGGDGGALVPFRTWRNTTTGAAADILTKRFNFNIPLRWSVAHLYQAVLNGEAHVNDIDYLTTLAGYAHYMLTGERALGVGDASGMFPIDGCDYDARMLESFGALIADRHYKWKIKDILPRVLLAGEGAGRLTEEGARLLDPSGVLKSGVPLCPPEGDAGTGMVATNAVLPRTGNVSAGTSVFAMLVLEKGLSKLHSEIDMVTTPDGKPVAMVHCNNCTSDIDAWARVFGEAAALLGCEADAGAVYEALYKAALRGDPDCGGLLAYNYLSGEPVTGLAEGRPLLMRMPDSRFTLANMMRALLLSSMASLKIGMDILTGDEGVTLDLLNGHGGLFKTPGVAQGLMADALGVPLAVSENAGEGGAWGVAVLAAFMKHSATPLGQFLRENVFMGVEVPVAHPTAEGQKAFGDFLARYKACLPVERAAAECAK
jgi:sugar (pentulose or hexulose) kinase